MDSKDIRMWRGSNCIFNITSVLVGGLAAGMREREESEMNPRMVMTFMAVGRKSSFWP